MIYHIYWGTAGNAGLYLDEIYQTLKRAGYKQKAFVNYYYPFEYGEKVFFKRTEMEHCKYKGILRKAIMGFELLYGLTRVFVASLRDKPRVINYSYAGWGNGLIYLFLKLTRHFNRGNLVITCHDVIPSVRSKKGYDKELRTKAKCYAIADKLLVHNENSIDDLKKCFGVDRDKVLIHPFPIMDLSKLDKGSDYSSKQYDFLFIGHLRREKGVEILFESWPEFHKKCPKATLCVAGNPAFYEEYIMSRKEICDKCNIDLRLGFISDEDYIGIVKSANCVVFPYTAGTNSGVISTVISLGRNVITSDIGMFANNPLVPKENMFKAGDKEALISLMKKVYHEAISHNADVSWKCANDRIKIYREDFDAKVVAVCSALTRIPS